MAITMDLQKFELFNAVPLNSNHFLRHEQRYWKYLHALNTEEHREIKEALKATAEHGQHVPLSEDKVLYLEKCVNPKSLTTNATIQIYLTTFASRILKDTEAIQQAEPVTSIFQQWSDLLEKVLLGVLKKNVLFKYHINADPPVIGREFINEFSMAYFKIVPLGKQIPFCNFLTILARSALRKIKEKINNHEDWRDLESVHCDAEDCETDELQRPLVCATVFTVDEELYLRGMKYIPLPPAFKKHFNERQSGENDADRRLDEALRLAVIEIQYADSLMLQKNPKLQYRDPETGFMVFSRDQSLGEKSNAF